GGCGRVAGGRGAAGEQGVGAALGEDGARQGVSAAVVGGKVGQEAVVGVVEAVADAAAGRGGGNAADGEVERLAAVGNEADGGRDAGSEAGRGRDGGAGVARGDYAVGKRPGRREVGGVARVAVGQTHFVDVAVEDAVADGVGADGEGQGARCQWGIRFAA